MACLEQCLENIGVLSQNRASCCSSCSRTSNALSIEFWLLAAWPLAKTVSWRIGIWSHVLISLLPAGSTYLREMQERPEASVYDVNLWQRDSAVSKRLSCMFRQRMSAASIVTTDTASQGLNLEWGAHVTC